MENTKTKGTLSLHITICDDNAADRRQLERLLGRESEKRARDTGVFYIDSYGNTNAALQSPQLYDAFFIDMVSDPADGASLALRLLAAGVVVPVVLCVSSIDYRRTLPEKARLSGQEKKLQHICYLDKPVKAAELSSLLDLCVSKKSMRTGTVELRGEQQTRYVPEDDILYASAAGCHIHVFLRDGSTMEIPGRIENFYMQLSSFTHYAAVSSRTFVNIIHIKRLTPFRVEMQDGSVHRTSPLWVRDIKTALRQCEREL